MAKGSLDRWTPLPAIVVADGALDGQRLTSIMQNSKRTEKLQIRVTGNLAVTVKGTGLANRGSILGALGDIGLMDNNADAYVLDARLARYIGEAMGPSALPAIRAADATIAATALVETVPLWLSSAKAANPNFTKYIETNIQAPLLPFITMSRRNSGGGIPGIITGGAATLTGVQVSLQQVYDDLIGSKPYFTTIVREIVQNVSGANTQLRIDLRNARYIRGIAIQQDSDGGEVQDIITSLDFRGDGRSILGDAQIPFADLVEHLAEECGGDIIQTPGYLWLDFQRHGRITSWLNPNQDVNLRLDVNVVPGAGVNPRIRVAIVEYQKTAACNPVNPWGM